MSEFVLPEGWSLTSLGEIADWGSGGTPSRKTESYYGGTIPWVKTGDLGPKILTQASEFITKQAVANSSAKFFPKGSVAIAMYGATIGRTSILGIDVTTNQACGVGNPVKGITFTEFLYYMLCNEKYNFIAKGKGGAQPNISQALIKEHEIELPPLAEQQQIAQNLDELLAQVDTLKTRLDTIPKILKRFRQSVLTAAVSGKLTEEWRQENMFSAEACLDAIKIARFKLWKETELEKYAEKGSIPPKEFEKKYLFPEALSKLANVPDSWLQLSWNQISMWITYGFTRPMPHVNQGPAIITAKNVRDGKMDLQNVHCTTALAFDELRPKDKPREGDLLIVKDGATTGRASIAPKDIGDYCISQSVAVVWLKYSPMERKFLLWCVQSEGTQRQIQKVMAGMAMPHLSITDFGQMIIGVPPLEEQTEIVRRVEQLFAYADQIEQRVKDAQARVNHLTQSILAKAFRGELTAEWRAQNPELISGENSAAALLEKIKAERNATVKPKRKVKA